MIWESLIKDRKTNTALVTIEKEFYLVDQEDKILKSLMQEEMEPMPSVENLLQEQICPILDPEGTYLHLVMKAEDLIGSLQVGGEILHQLEEEVHLLIVVETRYQAENVEGK